MLTFGRLKKRYANTIVLAVPKPRKFLWNKKTVKTWSVLQTVSNIADCEKAINYYENHGYCDVVPISTHLQEEVDIPPYLVAKFFRVYYGMQ